MAMRTTTLGSDGPEVGVIGLGCMGMTASYDMATPRDRRDLDLGHPPGARPGHDPDRHRRRVRAVHQRGAGRTGPGRRPPRARGAGDQGRPGDGRVHAERRIRHALPGFRAQRPPRARAGVDRRQPAPARHRSRGPLPAPPGGPGGAARGDLGGDGGDRGGRQGAAHRPFRGVGGGDQAGAGGASRDLGAVRAVALDPRRAARGAPLLQGAGHRPAPVLPAGPGLPRRAVLVVRRPAPGRLPAGSAPLPAGRPAGQPGHRRQGARGRRAGRGDAGPGGVGLGAGPGPAGGAHPRDQDAEVPCGQRRSGGVELGADDLADLDALPAPEGTRY